MMDSEAWKDLSGNTRAIYLEISKRYNGTNNGQIVYSVRQAAEELKIGKSTAARAFDQLESHGFIVVEQRGHFHWKINPNGSKHRPASEWRLTVYGSNIAPDFDSQQHGTKEFMRWQKTQNTVPPQVRMVPAAKPYGPTRGTMTSKKGLNEPPPSRLIGPLAERLDTDFGHSKTLSALENLWGLRTRAVS